MVLLLQPPCSMRRTLLHRRRIPESKESRITARQRRSPSKPVQRFLSIHSSAQFSGTAANTEKVMRSEDPQSAANRDSLVAMYAISSFPPRRKGRSRIFAQEVRQSKGRERETLRKPIYCSRANVLYTKSSCCSIKSYIVAINNRCTKNKCFKKKTLRDTMHSCVDRPMDISPS